MLHVWRSYCSHTSVFINYTGAKTNKQTIKNSLSCSCFCSLYFYLTLRCNEKQKKHICYIYLPFTNTEVMQHNACYQKCTSECKCIGLKSILTKHVTNTLVNVNSLGPVWRLIVSLYYCSKERVAYNELISSFNILFMYLTSCNMFRKLK